MDVLTLLAVAVGPGVAIAIYIYRQDKFEREPRKILLISFLLGALAILPALYLEILGTGLVHADTSLFSAAIYTFLIVGATEEFCKFVMLRVYAYRKKEFNEPFDGIT